MESLRHHERTDGYTEFDFLATAFWSHCQRNAALLVEQQFGPGAPRLKASNRQQCPKAAQETSRLTKTTEKNSRIDSFPIKYLATSTKACNFVAVLQTLVSSILPGMTGFDSKMMWYVSMQRVDAPLFNIRHQTINWRKSLRSRCLIEV